MNAESPPSARTILVVEDEASIRTIVKLAMEMNGHRVLTASDGDEALHVAEDHQGPIDLVITDILLPGISGSDTIRTLVETRPGLNVIYISGYLGDQADLAKSETGQMRFLRKPFTPRPLVEGGAPEF